MFQHGTRSGYVLHGCTCPLCTAADREYKRARYRKLHPLKDKPARAIPNLPPHVRHGTRLAYNYYHCPCEACREANRVYSARLKGEVERLGGKR